MNPDEILEKIDSLTAEDLYKYICQGIITLDTLKESGNLDASKRKRIIALQATRHSEDDNAWDGACDTEEGCRAYLEQYPAGRHVAEALEKIKYFENKRLEEEAEKREILERIRSKPNSFTPGMLQNYLNNGTINRCDLKMCGAPDEIIDCLDNWDRIDIPQLENSLGETPESIPNGYTEVYFWGVPGSGKTCVLAAVLSTAERMGYLEIAKGPGYKYMLDLKNIFSDDISFLPGPSPVDTTQYLPFTLKKPNEKNARSVSLIELSGEIFQCFLYKNTNTPLPSDKLATFNSLIRFLNGENRKIHFFFVDYDRENRRDGEGYTQADYLNAAATFFNDKQYNLFSKTTDAIYIVITKSDLMDCDKNERVNNVSEYLQNKNFTAFVNSLRTKCERNSINAKRILGTPFALGSVYFRLMCLFDDENARNIIDILMRRIAPSKQSILDVFNR